MRYAPNGLRLKKRLSVVAGRRLPERPGRGPGRGLAARRRPGRCPARHAGRRLLRRRRRQDARHGRAHEQQGPRGGDGRLREPPRPLGPAPAPRRRAQRPSAVPCRTKEGGRRQSQMAEAPEGGLRPRAGRPRRAPAPARGGAIPTAAGPCGPRISRSWCPSRPRSSTPPRGW